MQVEEIGWEDLCMVTTAEGFVKLNFDRYSLVTLEQIRISGVIKYHRGKVIKGYFRLV